MLLKFVTVLNFELLNFVTVLNFGQRPSLAKIICLSIAWEMFAGAAPKRLDNFVSNKPKKA
jgi:hypothetical protein